MTLDANAIQRGLLGRVLGRKVLVFSETGSTNQDALDAAREGQAEGLVVIADHQTAGRGRLARSWESPPGINLYLSVLFRPDLPADTVSLLPIFAGIAVCETLREQAGVFALLKWPNDVIAAERKIAGILSESEAMGAEMGPVAVGIGINVNSRSRDFSDAVAPYATSVKAATGHTFDRGQLARSVIVGLDDWYARLRSEGPGPIVSRWTELSGTLGHRVVVDSGKETIRGKAIRLGRDGALVLRMKDGRERRITVGDVKHLSRGG